MARIGMTLSVPDLTGASRMLFYYARSLVRRGHEVVVVHGTPPMTRTGEPASIVPELQSEGIETRHSCLLRRPIPPFVYSQISRLIGRCDAIVGFNQRDRSAALKVAGRLGIPGILAVQNQHTFWGPPGVRQLKQYYYAKTIRECATQLVCTSPRTVDEVVGFGAERDRCTILINGIELPPIVSADDRREARRAMGVDESSRVFVNVGRLDTQKGQDLLIKAWADCDRSKESDLLCLIGDVTEGNQATRSARFKECLISQIDRLGVADSVRLMGWRNDIPNVLGAADGYVHSARWEGPIYPLAIMEAMSAGLPIVMTDCSGDPDGFEAGTHGYVARTGSAESLNEAVSLLLDRSNEERRVMGQACRNYSEQYFDIDVIGNRFVDIIESELAKW